MSKRHNNTKKPFRSDEYIKTKGMVTSLINSQKPSLNYQSRQRTIPKMFTHPVKELPHL